MRFSIGINTSIKSDDASRNFAQYVTKRDNKHSKKSGLGKLKGNFNTSKILEKKFPVREFQFIFTMNVLTAHAGLASTRSIEPWSLVR